MVKIETPYGTFKPTRHGATWMTVYRATRSHSLARTGECFATFHYNEDHARRAPRRHYGGDRVTAYHLTTGREMVGYGDANVHAHPDDALGVRMGAD